MRSFILAAIAALALARKGIPTVTSFDAVTATETVAATVTAAKPTTTKVEMKYHRSVTPNKMGNSLNEAVKDAKMKVISEITGQEWTADMT